MPFFHDVSPDISAKLIVSACFLRRKNIQEQQQPSYQLLCPQLQHSLQSDCLRKQLQHKNYSSGAMHHGFAEPSGDTSLRSSCDVPNYACHAQLIQVNPTYD